MYQLPGSGNEEDTKIPALMCQYLLFFGGRQTINEIRQMLLRTVGEGDRKLWNERRGVHFKQGGQESFMRSRQHLCRDVAKVKP